MELMSPVVKVISMRPVLMFPRFSVSVFTPFFAKWFLSLRSAFPIFAAQVPSSFMPSSWTRPLSPLRARSICPV